MTTKHTTQSNKIWNIGLWIGQLLLAAMFLMVGFMKTFTPLSELSKIMPMAAEMPWFTRFVGVSELAGGLGLLLPAALRIKPILTAWAAAALALVMVLAFLYHLQRGEYAALGTNVTLALIAGVVAWGRFYKVRITDRTVSSTHSVVNG